MEPSKGNKTEGFWGIDYMISNTCTYKFPNCFGASVISNEYSYGKKQGLYELAVLKFKGDKDNIGEITYDTTITNDVIGHLTGSAVEHYLEQIKDLPIVLN